MIIQPNILGYICTTAHPIGCYTNVKAQIDYIKANGQFSGIKNALIIGASTGYGLASRIAACFGANANTIGIIFERPADAKHTASPGWYNTAAFERIAHQEGHYAKTINGDAFSDEVKFQTAEMIRNDLKKVDLIIYSLASPRRNHPTNGQTYNSVIKPIGKPFTTKTLDPAKGEIKEITIDPATDAEINNTIAVMGGEDWEMWIDFLMNENLLAPEVRTVAYTYIGSQTSFPIYKEGTIGKAKDHLQKSAALIDAKLSDLEGRALISVNKAVVTQASSAIPTIPLYMSILFKNMKENGTHEGCIEQIKRLFKDHLYSSRPLELDTEGRIRLDNLELDPHVQQKIMEIWPKITAENLSMFADVKEYSNQFFQLFGFNLDGVNYGQDVDPQVKIESL